MNDDDTAYTALLTQLLSDTSSTRNQRVHSWIEHQYDFALSEHEQAEKDKAMEDGGDDGSYLFSCRTRSPSPSPSSSLGLDRGLVMNVDRPDSPLLPRMSVEVGAIEACPRPRADSSPQTPSYDALFFPAPSSPELLQEDEAREELERERALRFLVQEMAHWRMENSHNTPHKGSDKPLPAPPPPSPASSATQSSPSRKQSQTMRSRSSSIRISRLPSFTSTLSSDQSSTQDIFSPPVSVIVHGDTQHELHAAYELLAPKRDSCVLGSSPLPSPTMSTFSSSWNPGTELETEATTPYASFPASPASASFAASICLPASPESDKLVFPDAPAIETGNTNSRWSLATTASLAPSTAEPKTGYFTRPKTPSKNKAPKSPTTETAPSLLKTPTRKRTRFISLISRLSPRSENPPPAAQSPDDDNDSVDELDDDAEDIPKPVRGPSKKSSLASLRASFSLSRASFASHRPLDEEVPPLPTPTSASWPMPASPPRNSFSASRVSLAGGTPETEVIPPVPSRRPSGLSLRAEPSWSSLRGDAEPMSPSEEIPPMPTSASTVTSFSQIPPPPHSSRVSLAHSMSRASLVSRVSLAPSISQVSLSEFPAPPSTPGRARSLFGRPKTPSSANGKTPNTKIPSSKKSTSIKIKPRLSKLPMPASTDKLPFPASTAGVPPVPRSFVPPTKLRQPMPSLPPSPTSKLPPPPSIANVIPPTPSKDASMVSGTTTRLPVPSAQTPASPSQSKMATVRGFWRRGTLQV